MTKRRVRITAGAAALALVALAGSALGRGQAGQTLTEVTFRAR